MRPTRLGRTTPPSKPGPNPKRFGPHIIAPATTNPSISGTHNSRGSRFARQWGFGTPRRRNRNYDDRGQHAIESDADRHNPNRQRHDSIRRDRPKRPHLHLNPHRHHRSASIAPDEQRTTTDA